MKKSLFLLFSFSLTMSGCSILQQENNFNLTEQEVTSILNDACTIKRDKRQRYKIDGKRYKTLSSSKGYKKEALPHGMAQTLMENRLLAERSMICMTSQPLIKHFRCLLM